MKKKFTKDGVLKTTLRQIAVKNSTEIEQILTKKGITYIKSNINPTEYFDVKFVYSFYSQSSAEYGEILRKSGGFPPSIHDIGYEK